MLFSLLKYYLDFYISDTALKVFRSLYCINTSICHGVENYFPKLFFSDAIFKNKMAAMGDFFFFDGRQGLLHILRPYSKGIIDKLVKFAAYVSLLQKLCQEYFWPHCE